ncbi:hypothetical protein TSAR_014909 [Trichomalopsis sarcophagae]|uniref:CCHC-type domain-containing protein n=1 Tax=Trichomalopsis sarcophagae TaxID=543379 RepID=A0A232F396_9HYME|nr:hypothetical protein TSAR_014909 [Trichomalopsis sarcophagae]
MGEKNNLLKEKLVTKQCDSVLPRASYAEVINQPKPLRKKVPKITINNMGNESIDMKKKVIECLTREKKIQTKNMYYNKKEELVINCVNSDSVDLTEAVLKESLEGVCEVMKEELINPKIKIVGFDNYLNWSPAEIESDINSRNFSSFSNKGIALHTYKNKHSDTTTVLMQVPSDVYKFIKENNSKIYVGCQSCKVYYLSIRPCFNCGRYGYSGNKCKNNLVCLKCADSHKTNDCSNNITKCLNCEYSNLLILMLKRSMTPLDFYLWGYLKDIVYRERPTTANDMRMRIQNAYANIPRNVLIRTVEHFQQRLQLCLQVGLNGVENPIVQPPRGIKLGVLNIKFVSIAIKIPFEVQTQHITLEDMNPTEKKADDNQLIIS